jgi:hypothetical protein
MKLKDTKMVISDGKLSKRVKRLGASNFESIEETARRQADMLRRFEEEGIGDGYVGFHDCRHDHCGLVHCSPGCWFNIRRRWLMDVLAAEKLLRGLDGPLYQMWLGRGAWRQPFGRLNVMNIDAVKQSVRSRLNTRRGQNDLVIGMFKLSSKPGEDGWIGQVHAITAGFEKMHELRRAFRSMIFEEGGDSWIEEVRDLPAVLVEVLRPDARVWQWPGPDDNADRLSKKFRSEFYRWQLRHPASQRLIRYGCDQYFHRLIKKPKKTQPKIDKKRPKPVWLEKYMYGSHRDGCRCRICTARR